MFADKFDYPVRPTRRLDATKHYQAASGEDVTTAVEVLELLAPDDR